MGQKVRRSIKDAKEALKILMTEFLHDLAESEIEQIMRNYRKLTPANKINAIKDISQTGLAFYKSELLSAVAVIAATALESVREEVPFNVKIKLKEWDDEDRVMMGEFEKLPPAIRKRLRSQVELLTTTQKADLDKVIMFQFSSSAPSTDSEDTIRYDLYESADQWVNGNSIDAGAGILSARTINETRQAFFFEQDVLDQVDAFQFVNDVPETPICQDLNGTIFSADDPGFTRYAVPLHYNCDSYIIPILKGKLKGREITQLKPSSTDLEKYIQFSRHENCNGRVRLTHLSD